MAPFQFERAMVLARRTEPENCEVVNKWMDRWQVAMSVCYRAEEAGIGETFEVIAPTEALNELPEEVVSRYWQLRM